MSSRSTIHTSRRGFTLLELLLVLALLAALAAFIWPALEGPLASQRLRRAAEQVRAQLIRTRTKAITTGETFSFRYQPDGAGFRIEARTENEALLAAVSSSGQMGSQSPSSSGSQPPPTPPASSAPPEPIRPVEGVLPEGVVFAGGEVTGDSRSGQIADQERMKGSVDLSWSDPIFFYPDGTATAARVIVRGARDRAIVVQLRSLTAEARIGGVVSIEELRP